MTPEEYYRDTLPCLKQTEQELHILLKGYPALHHPDGLQQILYCKSRIKSPESTIRKLALHGLPADPYTAVEQMHDIVGIRAVCSFVDDVYALEEWLCRQPNIRILKKKDYIARPKPNGYRSLHLLLRFDREFRFKITAEIQLRTIALDFWAALEHQLKYKRSIENEKIIRAELKRCADEIASVDMSMQTLRDIIRSDPGNK